MKEVVEPILKPTHLVNKIARSHDIDKQKSEISEPILSASTITQNLQIKQQKQQSIPMESNVSSNEWIPTSIINTTPQTVIKIDRRFNIANITESKNHRHSRNNYKNQQQNLIEETYNFSIEENPKKNIVSITVQLLPQRLANMLEQAERYARMTLLPLISAHTPKILTDLVNTFTTTDNNPKYLPLSFEEVEYTTKGLVVINETNEIEMSTENATEKSEGRSNNDSVFIVYPQNYESDRSFNENNDIESKENLNIEEVVRNITTEASTTTTAVPPGTFKRRHKLYVNLPVYNESELMKANETKPVESKYIPLNFDKSKT